VAPRITKPVVPGAVRAAGRTGFQHIDRPVPSKFSSPRAQFQPAANGERGLDGWGKGPGPPPNQGLVREQAHVRSVAIEAIGKSALVSGSRSRSGEPGSSGSEKQRFPWILAPRSALTKGQGVAAAGPHCSPPGQTSRAPKEGNAPRCDRPGAKRP